MEYLTTAALITIGFAISCLIGLSQNATSIYLGSLFGIFACATVKATMFPRPRL
jgi:hypothetical protein